MVLLSLLFVGCGRTVVGGADVLSAADAHDGTVDQVVSECAGCGLGMDGDPAHAHSYEGFTLHFCSETCRSGFADDPQAGMTRLEAAVSR